MCLFEFSIDAGSARYTVSMLLGKLHVIPFDEGTSCASDSVSMCRNISIIHAESTLERKLIRINGTRVMSSQVCFVAGVDLILKVSLCKRWGL